MLIIGLLLVDQINIWIMIKSVLPNFFVQFRLVNLLLILMHFKHVGRQEPGTKASRSRSIPTGTLVPSDSRGSLEKSNCYHCA